MIAFSPRLFEGVWYLAITCVSFDRVSCSDRVPRRFKSAYKVRSTSALVSILQWVCVSACVRACVPLRARRDVNR